MDEAPTTVTLKWLQEAALHIGIDAIGVTTAEPFSALLPELRRYYEENRQSGFEHPIPEARIDPRLLMPEAKSLIAVALSYVTVDTRKMRRPPGRRGMVSVYAWGEDYHVILREKLNALVDAIEAYLGRHVRMQICVDTAPLVDRAIAERAGVGWIGKNCCIITPLYGSWVFLGTLITDLVIEEAKDQMPIDIDDCGTCDLCMRACPTGAILAAGVLDSKRCLAYLTQSKGTIPERFRVKMGRRVWGCDTCQTVCPKNPPHLVGHEPRFKPQPELAFPELCEILQLSNRSFARRYGHTAAAWRGANVWKRNALYILGHMKYREALPLILPYLQHARPELRASAAWALAHIDPEQSRRAVLAARAQEMDEEVKREMNWAIETV